MRFARLTCSGLLVLSLAACGGGGGEAAPTYLAGTYNATLAKTQDNCFIGGVYGGHQHVVTLSGSDVHVQVNTLRLDGGAREDGGLSAVYEKRDEKAISRATVTYAMPAGQTAPGNGTFNAELLIEGVDIASGFTCKLRYNGQVTKVG